MRRTGFLRCASRYPRITSDSAALSGEARNRLHEQWAAGGGGLRPRLEIERGLEVATFSDPHRAFDVARQRWIDRGPATRLLGRRRQRVVRDVQHEAEAKRFVRVQRAAVEDQRQRALPAERVGEEVRA